MKVSQLHFELFYIYFLFFIFFWLSSHQENKVISDL